MSAQPQRSPCVKVQYTIGGDSKWVGGYNLCEADAIADPHIIAYELEDGEVIHKYTEEAP